MRSDSVGISVESLPPLAPIKIVRDPFGNAREMFTSEGGTAGSSGANENVKSRTKISFSFDMIAHCRSCT